MKKPSTKVKKVTVKAHTSKFRTGDIVIIGYGAMPHNDYSGFTARVEYCKTCCNAHRLQMLEWGNNEALAAFDQERLYKINIPTITN